MSIDDLFQNSSVIHLKGEKRYLEFLIKVEEILENNLKTIKDPMLVIHLFKEAQGKFILFIRTIEENLKKFGYNDLKGENIEQISFILKQININALELIRSMQYELQTIIFLVKYYSNVSEQDKIEFNYNILTDIVLEDEEVDINNLSGINIDFRIRLEKLLEKNPIKYQYAYIRNRRRIIFNHLFVIIDFLLFEIEPTEEFIEKIKFYKNQISDFIQILKIHNNVRYHLRRNLPYLFVKKEGRNIKFSSVYNNKLDYIEDFLTLLCTKMNILNLDQHVSLDQFFLDQLKIIPNADTMIKQLYNVDLNNFYRVWSDLFLSCSKIYDGTFLITGKDCFQEKQRLIKFLSITLSNNNAITSSSYLIHQFFILINYLTHPYSNPIMGDISGRFFEDYIENYLEKNEFRIIERNFLINEPYIPQKRSLELYGKIKQGTDIDIISKKGKFIFCISCKWRFKPRFYKHEIEFAKHAEDIYYSSQWYFNRKDVEVVIPILLTNIPLTTSSYAFNVSLSKISEDFTKLFQKLNNLQSNFRGLLSPSNIDI